MNTWILMGIMISIGMLVKVLNKKLQLSMQMDTEHLLFYNFLNALFASVCFCVATGFRIELNLITIIFAFVYALIVLASLTMSMLVLSKLSLAFVGVIAGAGGIVWPALFGVVYFGENISLSLICAVLLMLTAAVFPLLEGKTGHSTVKGAVVVPIAVVYFVLCGASAIWSKLYASTPGVCDSKSCFLLVNVILVIGTGGVLYVHFRRNSEGRHSSMRKLFTKKQVVNIGTQTIASNICSVLGVLILVKMDVSIYTIVQSSLTLIIGTFISKFYFKEYVTWKNWVSLVLAVVACTISAKMSA